MSTRKFICSVTLVAIAAIWAGCGGGSSGTTSSGGGTSDSGTGVASVDSLSALPTVDLSQYDSSTSTSANLSALLSKSLSASKGISKGFGEGLRDVGKSSRAGCEANMHKKEAIRMSQSVALDRCYPEAMEAAGFITIPTGSRNCYSITPPEESAEERAQKCADIPAEYEDQKAACEAGSEGASGGLKMRIGKIDDELQIDMFEGASLVDEATYGASGDTYTANVVRIGNWGGNLESSSFAMTIDLGAAGSVTDG
ncbi:MAG: hypothetical protein HYU83_03980, partial [Chloroflexi bacterium]|nr:hypothetical protein [Chloroflexota bacterium]